MTPQPNDPGAPGEAPANPPASASGLDESQIAQEDLEEIAGIFAPRFLKWESPQLGALNNIDIAADPRLRSSLTVKSITPGLSTPKNLKIKILPLPNRIHAKHVSVDLRRPHLHKGLGPVLKLPVRRQRLGLNQLSLDMQETLLRALFKKYGEASHKLHVQGVFAHVPPELAQSVRISKDGREAAFLVPQGFDARRASADHYLVVLMGDDGETRRVLFRL